MYMYMLRVDLDLYRCVCVIKAVRRFLIILVLLLMGVFKKGKGTVAGSVLFPFQ